MSNEILVHTSGTPKCWADSTQYSSTLSGLTRTNEINLKGLAANAARQGSKADLGVKRPGGYSVKAGVAFAVAPTAGGAVEFYWSSSPLALAGSGNAGGVALASNMPYVSGVDGPYTPAGAAEADIDEYKGLLSFVGVIGAGADAEVLQEKVINSYFVPPERYGQFVIKNDASQTFSANGSGVYIAMIPNTDEIQ
jgi:hypothetical protein